MLEVRALECHGRGVPAAGRGSGPERSGICTETVEGVGAGMVRRKAMVGGSVCLEEQEEGHCDWTTEDGGSGAV